LGTTYIVPIYSVYYIYVYFSAATAAQLSNSSIDDDDDDGDDDYNAAAVGCSPVLLVVIAYNICERTHTIMRVFIFLIIIYFCGI